MGKLKVGIIGVGGIAGAHVPGWEASTEADLAAGCDVDEEVLERWGEARQVTRLYTDAAQLLADREIDIVDICTFYAVNLETRQYYDRTLKLLDEGTPSHAQECIEFAQAIAGEGDSPVPAEESLQVMSILDGIYRSQQTGREVALD